MPRLSSEQLRQGQKTSQRFAIPLRLLLIVPFTALLITTTALVGYLSFHNGRHDINLVAGHLRGELNQRIADHVQRFLDTPRQIGSTLVHLLQHRIVDADDPVTLETYLWQTIRRHPSVTSIYFGNTRGGLVDAGREGADGSLYVMATDDFRSGPLRKFTIDDQGRRGPQLTSIEHFDARSRSWYQAAVTTGKPIWTEVYPLITGQDLAVAAGEPVFDRTGALLGVVSVDLFLSHLGSFLSSLKVGTTGQAFIVERSGLLISSSADPQPLQMESPNQPPERLPAVKSSSPLIRAAAEALTSRFSTPGQRLDEQFEVELDGKRMLLHVSSLSGLDAPDWLIVTAIPEADFMTHITRNSVTTSLLIGISTVLAAGLGVIIAFLVSQPVLQLNRNARILAKGNLSAPATKSQVKEINQLSETFAGMVRDIHQLVGQLHTEILERQETELALREREEQLQLTLQAAELGTWDWNIQTGAVRFNDQWAHQLGYAPDEIEPDVRSWQRLLHPDDEALIRDTLADHLAGKTPLYQTEHRLRTKAGRWIWILDTGKVIERDAQQRPLRAIGIHQDITITKEMREQLSRQERLATIGQMAAGIAHDFNNIMHGIMGYTDLLSLTTQPTEEQLKTLHKIQALGRQASFKVRQLLDFSQRTNRILQRLDLRALIADSLQQTASRLPATIELAADLAEDLPEVDADPEQLRQVVDNLTANAIKAVPDGGRIHVKLSRQTIDQHGGRLCVICNEPLVGTWIRIDISDTGHGIADDILPHIFEPFFTTREIGQGTGLGLPQVAGIIAQHGGHLTVVSSTGAESGTTISIFLPLSPEPVDKNEQRDASTVRRKGRWN